jgi:putative ABC transport system permease protein
MIGFVPGLGVSWLLYDFVGGATFLPLDMYPARAGMVFALILGMCVIAGLLAMRKLRDANPADMF